MSFPRSVGLAELPRVRRAFRRGYLEGFELLFREYGDVVRLPAPVPRLVLFRPEHVEHVLRTNASNYTKSGDYRLAREVMGDGLVASEGEKWRRDRRKVAPELHLGHVRRQTTIIVEKALTLLERWRREVPGEPVRDLESDMGRLSFGIVGKALLGVDDETLYDDFHRASLTAQRAAVGRLTSLVRLPPTIPTPSNIRYRRAIATLDGAVAVLIETYESSQPQPGNLLSILIEGASDRGDLLGHVKTLILAGYDTVTNALSWTWHLLSRHPGVWRALKSELNDVLRGRAPGWDDYPKLQYLGRVIEESLRLYPPAAEISKQAVAADSIDGFEIPRGITVDLVQWVTHRHPDYWDEPERFDPSRFEEPHRSRRHPYAYFPFSGGLRSCVGRDFALLELVLVLATLIPHVDVEPLEGFAAVPEALITVRPRYGVKLKLRLSS